MRSRGDEILTQGDEIFSQIIFSHLHKVAYLQSLKRSAPAVEKHALYIVLFSAIIIVFIEKTYI
jgi:hypothetical protein